MLNNCITEKNKTTQTHIIKHIYKILKQEIYAINLIKIKHYQRYFQFYILKDTILKTKWFNYQYILM